MWTHKHSTVQSSSFMLYSGIGSCCRGCSSAAQLPGWIGSQWRTDNQYVFQSCNVWWKTSHTSTAFSWGFRMWRIVLPCSEGRKGEFFPNGLGRPRCSAMYAFGLCSAVVFSLFTLPSRYTWLSYGLQTSFAVNGNWSFSIGRMF
jgi:hypothetical protein